MTLQYLGTAAAEGWPALFCDCTHCQRARALGGRNIRTRSQAILFAEGLDEGTPDQRLLIDLPPDTYHHVLAHGLRLDRVGHLIITHSHDDHLLGTELQYRGPWYAAPVPSFPLHVYGNDMVLDKIAKAIGDGKQENIVLHHIEPGDNFTAGEFNVTALPALHDRRQKCLFYLVEHKGKRVLYGNDTGFFPQVAWDLLAGKKLDIVSLDCTNCDKKEGTNHMGLPDAAEAEARLRLENCLHEKSKIIVHHFSHNGGVCYDDMVVLAGKYGYEVSYDGGVWEVG
jgi:phosphoribosyl 1,2-cyclic phosphate phosphodiesterase